MSGQAELACSLAGQLQGLIGLSDLFALRPSGRVVPLLPLVGAEIPDRAVGLMGVAENPQPPVDERRRQRPATVLFFAQRLAQHLGGKLQILGREFGGGRSAQRGIRPDDQLVASHRDKRRIGPRFAWHVCHGAHRAGVELSQVSHEVHAVDQRAARAVDPQAQKICAGGNLVFDQALHSAGARSGERAFEVDPHGLP